MLPLFPPEWLEKQSEKLRGDVCGVALQSAEKALSAHFVLPIGARSTFGVLLRPLFGQFHKINSPKLDFQVGLPFYGVLRSSPMRRSAIR